MRWRFSNVENLGQVHGRMSVLLESERGGYTHTWCCFILAEVLLELSHGGGSPVTLFMIFARLQGEAIQLFRGICSLFLKCSTYLKEGEWSILVLKTRRKRYQTWAVPREEEDIHVQFYADWGRHLMSELCVFRCELNSDGDSYGSRR